MTDRTDIYDADTEGWGTALHVLFWIGLCMGFWFEWTPIMMIGFFVTIGNIQTFGALFLANAVVLLISLPFASKTAFDANFRFALLMGVIIQVWQFSVWIQGAAAH